MAKALAILLLLSPLVVSEYALAAEEPEPGLSCEFFNIGQELGDFPDVKDQRAAWTWVDKEVNVDAGDGAWPNTDVADYFYVRWTGVIRIEKDGKHKFHTESDDGSRLSIDGRRIVDNGGLHAAEEKSGEVELSAGDHEIKLEFFENTGEASCKLSWETPGAQKEIVPAKVLFHRKK